MEFGDGSRLRYVSARQGSKKDAQKAAFAKALSYILFRGPRHLRNHPSQWHIDRLKNVMDDAEQGLLRQRLGPRPRGQWTPLSSPNAAAARGTRGFAGVPAAGFAGVPAASPDKRAELEYLLSRLGS